LAHLRAGRAARSNGGETVRRRDAGETLLEVMMSITLMTIAFAAILGGIFASARTANFNRDRTKASTALQAYAESLLQPVGPNAYKICTTTTDKSDTDTSLNSQNQANSFPSYLPTAPPGTLPTGWKVKIAKIAYLSSTNPFPANSFGTAEAKFPNSGSGYNQQAATDTCINNRDTTVSPERDGGVQMIYLVVYRPSEGGDIPVDSIVVTKRDQRCSAAAANADYVDQGPC
jgi:hypothetical protein